MLKSEADQPAIESVIVTIFNQTYSLRSPGGGARIRRIATQVDERMRQISEQITTHDIGKIAILAALNIADELQNVRDYYEQEIQNLRLRDDVQPAPKDVEPPAEPATPSQVAQVENDSGSWFDAIFDAEAPVRKRERLSSKISAKLQSIREAEQQALTIEEGEAGK